MSRLIFALILSATLLGCATTPTPTQEAAGASALRIATVAYVTRAKTAEAQAERAAKVITVAGVLRGYVAENGNVVLNLDAAAAVANARIQASDLSASDKQLAQAIVVEAVLLAGDQVAASGANIGQENARLLLKMVGEIERTARVFAPMS